MFFSLTYIVIDVTYIVMSVTIYVSKLTLYVMNVPKSVFFDEKMRFLNKFLLSVFYKSLITNNLQKTTKFPIFRAKIRLV